MPREVKLLARVTFVTVAEVGFEPSWLVPCCQELAGTFWLFP